MCRGRPLGKEVPLADVPPPPVGCSGEWRRLRCSERLLCFLSETVDINIYKSGSLFVLLLEQRFGPHNFHRTLRMQNDGLRH